MKRSTSDIKRLPKKIKKPAQLRIFDRLYNIGFKKTYILKWSSVFNDATWSSFDSESEFLSDAHIINDLVENIETISADIDDVLKNMRKKFRIKFKNITEDISDHYSVTHLVQIIIEYANGVYDPISTQQFLYNDTEQSNWFSYRKFNKEYKYYNATDVHDVHKALSLNIKPNHQYFFHATNWQNLQDIIEVGPKYDRGRMCLDFGISKSFYVTPDIDTAIQWAQSTRFNNEGGILIFSVNTNQCRKLKVFESATDEWKTLVKESRLCKRKYNDLDSYYFVFGPMLQNFKQIKQKNTIAKTHQPIKWQMASKSNSSDAFLQKHMLGAIILKKMA